MKPATFASAIAWTIFGFVGSYADGFSGLDGASLAWIFLMCSKFLTDFDQDIRCQDIFSRKFVVFPVVENSLKSDR